MDRSRKPFVFAALVVAILASGGCNPLAPRPILHGGYRVAPELIADASLARQVLDWEPRYTDIREIVETAWKWHQSHPRGYATA